VPPHRLTTEVAMLTKICDGVAAATAKVMMR
jgi:hypothetical protein